MRRDGNNILLTLEEWQAAGLSYKIYKNDKQRGYLRTANIGGGGHPVEIIWQSIVKECRKTALKAYFKGDPEKMSVQNEIKRHIREDAEIKTFFTKYKLPTGESLGEKNYQKVLEYYNNAIIMEAVGAMLQFMKSERKSKGNQTGLVWSAIANAVNELNAERYPKYPHTLPAHERRLREKYANYRREGLAFLVHKSYGNKFSRKVDERLEWLILSIYCKGNKPYAKWVHEDYMKFIAGLLDIVDMKTGALFNREDYRNKKGQYITISESTCWNYINNPRNRAIVDALRNSEDFHTTDAPHYHRHAPEYAFSKITMDDVNLPQLMRKDKDGHTHVMAYYVYDVCSTALIGAAHSVRKDGELFKECLRDMYRFMDAHSYGVPIEVELEHHIAGDFQDTFLAPGVLFERVYWCAPGNSQEKHAEHFNRQKKYGYAKRLLSDTGRHYAKLEANKTGGARVWDNEAQEYIVKKQEYSYEEIVASDLEVIAAYNNGLHPDQRRYKGMTRLEVLHARMHPNLAPVNLAALARWLGECTTTTIRRNMYFQVRYEKYMLPTPELLGRLAPNNYTVQAYYMPSVDGSNKDSKDSKDNKNNTERVFIYQHGKFLAECQRIKTFTTAQAEWTDADTAAQAEQAKFVAKFGKIVGEGKDKIIDIKEVENIARYEAVIAETVETMGIEGMDENCEPALVGECNVAYWAERGEADL